MIESKYASDKMLYIELGSKNISDNYGFGIRFFAKDDDNPMHIHDYYEVEYIKSGIAVQTVNGTDVEIHDGSLYILSPKDIHSVKLKSPLEIYSIFIKQNYENEGFLKLLSNCNQFVNYTCEKEEKAGVEYMLEELKKLYQTDTGQKDQHDHVKRSLMISLVSTLVGIILAKGSVLNKANESETPITKVMYATLRYINDNFSAPISLEEVANRAGYSKCYFSRFFKRYVGYNFVDYLRKVRLQHASMLINNTDMKMTEIAFVSGFGSITQFNRNYISEYGCTPSDKRRKKR